MEKSKCFLECARTKHSFVDENGNFKILTHKEANFKIQILEILPIVNPNIKDDYIVGFKTRHLTSMKEEKMDLTTLNHFYF